MEVGQLLGGEVLGAHERHAEGDLDEHQHLGDDDDQPDEPDAEPVDDVGGQAQRPGAGVGDGVGDGVGVGAGVGVGDGDGVGRGVGVGDGVGVGLEPEAGRARAPAW